MGSHSTFETGLDHKSLRKPDGFVSVLTSLFSEMTSHAGRVGVLVGVIFLIGLGIAIWMNQKDVQTSASRNALYLAEKAYEGEFKQLLIGGQKVNYQKIPVDAHFTKSIPLLKQVEASFRSTPAAYGARMKLGQIYFEHSAYEQALPWFQKAVEGAKGWDKAIALASLAYTYENMGQAAEAIQAYQKALNLGGVGMKGDLLLGVARCYMASRDVTQARNTYDQILKDLPNTDTARSAEFYKSQLPAS